MSFSNENDIAQVLSMLQGGASISEVETAFAGGGTGTDEATGYQTSKIKANGELEIIWNKGKKKGFFGKLWGGVKDGASSAWKWGKGAANDVARTAVSSIILVGSGIGNAVINQAHVIYKEGIHEGGAYDSKNNLSWAVPYKLDDNWKIVPQKQMMTEDLKWEDGKEVIKSTTNVLMMATPIKYDIPIPNASPLINTGINKGAAMGTKAIIKRGIQYPLNDDE